MFDAVRAFLEIWLDTRRRRCRLWRRYLSTLPLIMRTGYQSLNELHSLCVCVCVCVAMRRRNLVPQSKKHRANQSTRLYIQTHHLTTAPHNTCAESAETTGHSKCFCVCVCESILYLDLHSQSYGDITYACVSSFTYGLVNSTHESSSTAQSTFVPKSFVFRSASRNYKTQANAVAGCSIVNILQNKIPTHRYSTPVGRIALFACNKIQSALAC